MTSWDKLRRFDLGLPLNWGIPKLVWTGNREMMINHDFWAFLELSRLSYIQTWSLFVYYVNCDQLSKPWMAQANRYYTHASDGVVSKFETSKTTPWFILFSPINSYIPNIHQYLVLLRKSAFLSHVSHHWLIRSHYAIPGQPHHFFHPNCFLDMFIPAHRAGKTMS